MKITVIARNSGFKKQFLKLRVEIQQAFDNRIRLLLTDSNHPLLNIHHLHGKWNGYWSVNVTGDVRAVFYVQTSIAVFVAIGRHCDLYKE